MAEEKAQLEGEASRKDKKRAAKPLRQRIPVPIPEGFAARAVDGRAVLRDRHDLQLSLWHAGERLLFWTVILAIVLALML